VLTVGQLACWVGQPPLPDRLPATADSDGTELAGSDGARGDRDSDSARECQCRRGPHQPEVATVRMRTSLAVSGSPPPLRVPAPL
jgi:hypothetical protein